MKISKGALAKIWDANTPEELQITSIESDELACHSEAKAWTNSQLLAATAILSGSLFEEEQLKSSIIKKLCM